MSKFSYQTISEVLASPQINSEVPASPLTYVCHFCLQNKKILFGLKGHLGLFEFFYKKPLLTSRARYHCFRAISRLEFVLISKGLPNMLGNAPAPPKQDSAVVKGVRFGDS